MSPRLRRSALVALTGVGLLAGCTSTPGPSASPAESASPTTTSSSTSATAPTSSAGPTASATETTQTTPTATPTTARPPVAQLFDVAAVQRRVRAIAAIGPRDAVSPAYARAATYVTGQLESVGWQVRAQRFSVPAGTSWGVRVPGGTSTNLIADPPGFDSTRPHVVIGAHLDTVPQASGAEDNASGVATVVELARMLREQPAAVPVRLVVFGAEEARVPAGTRYAFGSRHYVTTLTDAERRATRGMLALDRVGVAGRTVPVCSGGRGTTRLARDVRAASPASATNGCTNRASDHVSFEASGIPAARLGSVPFDGYHSERDVPSVVSDSQLRRTGAVVWAWLRSL